MDLSGLIFVALAVAWAAYLIPKALRHHEDVVRGRSIDRFSHSLRVLARREPVDARSARLVDGHDQHRARTVAPPSTEEQYAARRDATHRATRRRRRVLGLLLLTLVAVGAAAALGRIATAYVGVPAGLLLAWLLACRLMVRKERAWRPTFRDESDDDSDRAQHDVPVAADQRAEPGADDDTSVTGSPVEAAEQTDRPGLWDPVPVTLPTYVSKPAARRSVRTIDLDATGVWTSGRTQADSRLAREADAAEAAERVRRRTSRKDDSDGEAVGS